MGKITVKQYTTLKSFELLILIQYCQNIFYFFVRSFEKKYIYVYTYHYIFIHVDLNKILIPTDCSNGFFGAGCDAQCSEFCRNKSCDRTTGTCLHGCEPGYVESHCNECQYSELAWYTLFII